MKISKYNSSYSDEMVNVKELHISDIEDPTFISRLFEYNFKGALLHFNSVFYIRLDVKELLLAIEEDIKEDGNCSLYISEKEYTLDGPYIRVGVYPKHILCVIEDL